MTDPHFELKGGGEGRGGGRGGSFVFLSLTAFLPSVIFFFFFFPKMRRVPGPLGLAPISTTIAIIAAEQA